MALICMTQSVSEMPEVHTTKRIVICLGHESVSAYHLRAYTVSQRKPLNRHFYRHCRPDLIFSGPPLAHPTHTWAIQRHFRSCDLWILNEDSSSEVFIGTQNGLDLVSQFLFPGIIMVIVFGPANCAI